MENMSTILINNYDLNFKVHLTTMNGTSNIFYRNSTHFKKKNVLYIKTQIYICEVRQFRHVKLA